MLLGTIKEMTENPPTILFPYVIITMQHPLQKHNHLVVVFQLGLQTIVHHGIQSLWFASLDTAINSAYFSSLAQHILANITSVIIYHSTIKHKLRCVNLHMHIFACNERPKQPTHAFVHINWCWGRTSEQSHAHMLKTVTNLNYT